MSDLQCAATLLLVPPDRIEALLPAVSGARIAHVWCDGSPEAVRAARTAAARLGVRTTERAGIDAHLDEVADEHRGETVLVVLERDEAVELVIDGDARVRRAYPPSSSE